MIKIFLSLIGSIAWLAGEILAVDDSISESNVLLIFAPTSFLIMSLLALYEHATDMQTQQRPQTMSYDTSF